MVRMTLVSRCLAVSLVTAAVFVGIGSVPGSATLVGGSSAARPLGSSGAAIAPAIRPSGRSSSGTITAPGGSPRTYVLYVPRSLPKGRPVPLLVALHGGLGSGRQFEQNAGFDGLAEADHFIVVYPNGTPVRAAQPDRLVWNGGGCCSVAEQSREDVDDVGFISALITKLEGRYAIDPSRVYATGHSNGAILAERLACEISDRIVAIGVQAGVLMIADCPTSHPVSVLEIHGTADQNIPINGGMGSRSLTPTGFPPPVDGLQTFAGRDGCASQPVTRKVPSNPAVHLEQWPSCRAGSTVEWAKVTGANHAWMGHPASLASELVVGKPYQGFDSSAAIWSFLSAHPRR